MFRRASHVALALVLMTLIVFFGCSSGDPNVSGPVTDRVSGPPATVATTCLPCDCFCGSCETQKCSCAGACLGCTHIAGCCTTDAECTPYLCNTATSTCRTSCTVASDCTLGTCGGGTCNNWKPTGSTCIASSECISTFCADGYCCNNACNGTCASCKLLGAKGTCSPVAAGGLPLSGHPACSGTTGGTCGQTCDGVDTTKCNYPSTTTACGASSCSTATNSQTTQNCDGSGACKTLVTSCVPYVCGATACKTSCTTGTDCAPGDACNLSTSTCLPLGTKGAPCPCSTGLTCVDSVCCDTTSCPAGSTCNGGPGKSGSCAKLNGQKCTAGSECGSTNCIDGVCCDKACGGQCQACDVGGSIGTCTNVTKSQPHTGAGSTTRPACPGGGTTTCGQTCDGIDALACHYPTGTTTCGVNACATGTETHLGSCNGSGLCADGAKGCFPYVCGATSCKTTCADTTDCVGGYFCDTASKTCKTTPGLGTACTTTCTAPLTCIDSVCCGTSTCPAGSTCAGSKPGTCQKKSGTACSDDIECSSGHCIDGVCCKTTCTSQCAACDVAGSLGDCKPVTGLPHGTRASCVGTGVGTTCGIQCNGFDPSACNYPDSSLVCGGNTCSGSIEHHLGTCNGTGKCDDAPKSCGGYGCDPTTCKTTCATKTDCQAGFLCKGGACVPLPGLGDACASSAECTTGFCTDGVCCNVGKCGDSETCAGALKKGTCSTRNGAKCTDALGCGSGICVDSVCCDAKCTGQCESCDGTTPGTCSPTNGKPHGTRAPCADGGGDVCKASICDGSDRTTCAALADSKIVCKPQSCVGDTLTTAGACDGAGTCKPGENKSCSPYNCDGANCRTSCSKNEECASGFTCGADGKCGTKAGTCSPDGHTSISPDGVVKDCGTYLCSGGNCLTTCGATGDCAPGNTCDLDTHTCTPSSGAAPTDKSGGCGCTVPGDTPEGSLSWLAGAALSIVLLRRRRRPSMPVRGLMRRE